MTETASSMISSAQIAFLIRELELDDRSSFAGTPWATSQAITDKISVHDYVRIVGNIAEDSAQAKRFLDLFLATIPKFASNGLLFGLQCAPTKRDGFNLLARFGDAASKLHRCHYDESGSRATFSLAANFDVGSAALLLHEPRLACLYDHILIFESTHRSEIEISFAHQYDPRLSLNFGSPTIYGANVNSLSFPLEWASKPNPFYDADLWRMAIDRCEAQNVEALSAEQAVQIQVELMSVLIQTGDVPTLKKFAASRGQSTRSFSRDLERSGTNYRALTDSIRMRRAAEYLLQDQWTIERISDHLGFADPSSFRRSFRRWFGQAPSDWQRQRRMW